MSANPYQAPQARVGDVAAQEKPSTFRIAVILLWASFALGMMYGAWDGLGELSAEGEEAFDIYIVILVVMALVLSIPLIFVTLGHNWARWLWLLFFVGGWAWVFWDWEQSVQTTTDVLIELSFLIVDLTIVRLIFFGSGAAWFKRARS